MLLFFVFLVSWVERPPDLLAGLKLRHVSLTNIPIEVERPPDLLAGLKPLLGLDNGALCCVERSPDLLAGLKTERSPPTHHLTRRIS